MRILAEGGRHSAGMEVAVASGTSAIQPRGLHGGQPAVTAWAGTISRQARPTTTRPTTTGNRAGRCTCRIAAPPGDWSP